MLLRLRELYSVAIQATMICATVAICLSIPATFGMRFLNLAKGDTSATPETETVTETVIVRCSPMPERPTNQLSQKVY